MFEEDLREYNSKKKRFTIIYNGQEDIAFGKGYYFIYENYEGKPTFECKYSVYEYSKEVDMVSVGVINKINDLYYKGYIYDRYYAANINLKDLF